MFQPLILKSEQSGLLMRTAATESVSFVRADEKLTAFLELEKITRESNVHGNHLGNGNFALRKISLT